MPAVARPDAAPERFGRRYSTSRTGAPSDDSQLDDLSICPATGISRSRPSNSLPRPRKRCSVISLSVKQGECFLRCRPPHTYRDGSSLARLHRTIFVLSALLYQCPHNSPFAAPLLKSEVLVVSIMQCSTILSVPALLREPCLLVLGCFALRHESPSRVSAT